MRLPAAASAPASRTNRWLPRRPADRSRRLGFGRRCVPMRKHASVGMHARGEGVRFGGLAGRAFCLASSDKVLHAHIRPSRARSRNQQPAKDGIVQAQGTPRRIMPTRSPLLRIGISSRGSIVRGRASARRARGEDRPSRTAGCWQPTRSTHSQERRFAACTSRCEAQTRADSAQWR